MMSGGSDGASGLNIGSLIGSLAGTGSDNKGGGLGNSLASVGSLVGNFVPGAGLVGQGLGAVVNLIGGKEHVPDGAGAFAGLHSPTLAPLDDSTMFKEDAAVYVAIAKVLGISVEEAAMGLAYDSTITGHTPAYTFDAYSAAGSNPSAVLGWILEGNKRFPGARIVPGELGPARLTVPKVSILVTVHGSPSIVDLNSKVTDQGNQYAAGTPLGTSIYEAQAAMYPQGVPLGTPIGAQSSLAAASQSLAGTTGTGVVNFQNAASQGADKGTLLDQLAKAMWDGAKTGATDVLADTDAAKAAKADYFKEFVSTYQLPLAAGGIGLVLLIKKAFFDQNG
jgi:hypothetical protein